MPVTVTTSDGGEEVHEDGVHFQLQEGHLVINYHTGRGYLPLAVYIPGSWTKAVVNKTDDQSD
jgi:hypothetical protein